jgi:hypothetical protein
MNLRLLTLAAALTATGAMAADEHITTLRFSDPTQPGRVRAVISNGELRIRGSDTDTVTIRTTAKAEQKSTPRDDGLRVITTSAQFTATEADNVITLEYGQMGWAHGASFELVVPRSTSVQLQSNFGGQVSVEDLQGDVEIKNMNGEIRLAGLGGGALVETMNGQIDASFVALPADKPLAFSSMNGEIRLRVPADAKANVRFRTQNGSILTDFPDDALVTKTEPGTGATFAPVAADVARITAEAAREAMHVARAVAEEVRVAVETEARGVRKSPGEAPRPPRVPRPPSIPAMAGGKVVSGTLNGGGAQIQIATMNGDIVVRKLQD